MRRYFKNDINKQAKPINQVKVYDIYFLLQDEDIVFVGIDIKASGGIPGHQKDKEFNRYFSYFVESKEDAERLENEYIKHLLPRYNLVGRLEQELEKIKPKKESSKELKTKPKKEREYIAVNPQVVVSMPAKQVIEMPVESVKIKAQKTYRTRPLVRYLQNISLQPGCYKIDKRNGTNYLFVNINNKSYYALADAERYTHEETTYRMPDEMKGYLKDIVVN